MNEWKLICNIIAHKKLPHKTLRVHNAKYTRRIHVCKLSQAKNYQRTLIPPKKIWIWHALAIASWPCNVTLHALLQTKVSSAPVPGILAVQLMKLHGYASRGRITIKICAKCTCSHIKCFIAVTRQHPQVAILEEKGVLKRNRVESVQQWLLLRVLSLFQVHGIIRRSSSFNTGRIEHLYADPKSHKEGCRWNFAKFLSYKYA